MRIALLWPIGPLAPGDVVEVDQRFGAVLLREGFARVASASVDVVEPAAPTMTEIVGYARKHGISTAEARRHYAEELASRRAGAIPNR